MVVMALDWRSMLRDKKLWAGAGVAAAVGAVVLYQRKRTTGSTSTGGAGTGTTGTVASGYVGGFDSTGTDVANWLGQYGGSLQNQLDAYNKQLTDSLASLQKMQTAPETPVKPGFAEARVWWDLDQWITDLQRTNPNATAENIIKLNPGILNDVDEVNRFTRAGWYKVPDPPSTTK